MDIRGVKVLLQKAHKDFETYREALEAVTALETALGAERDLEARKKALEADLKALTAEMAAARDESASQRERLAKELNDQRATMLANLTQYRRDHAAEMAVMDAERQAARDALTALQKALEARKAEFATQEHAMAERIMRLQADYDALRAKVLS